MARWRRRCCSRGSACRASGWSHRATPSTIQRSSRRCASNFRGSRRLQPTANIIYAEALMAENTGKAGEVVRSQDEWRAGLDPFAYSVLCEEGTERAGTSPLNKEKRSGTFGCAACNNPLFTGAMKFESGTGWPSFYDVKPGAVETKRDTKHFMTRTEYHCARCGGHQGHLFEDGPRP